jgi:hypothetical protein
MIQFIKSLFHPTRFTLNSLFGVGYATMFIYLKIKFEHTNFCDFAVKNQWQSFFIFLIGFVYSNFLIKETTNITTREFFKLLPIVLLNMIWLFIP